MPATILIADDDPHIRQVLSFALSKAGLNVREAEDGAGRAGHRRRPRHRSCGAGHQHAADGRAGDLPPVACGGEPAEIDRVLGIELGADDYVVKPFSPREVVARAIAILRRTAAAPRATPDEPIVRHGALMLDREGWRAASQGTEVALTATEFQLLRTLATMPSKVFSRDALIDWLHGPGFAITDRTIDSQIRNLRAKFVAVGCETLIETRAGVGYRLGACAAGAR